MHTKCQKCCCDYGYKFNPYDLCDICVIDFELDMFYENNIEPDFDEVYDRYNLHKQTQIRLIKLNNILK
jgi:hypothetical protein